MADIEFECGHCQQPMVVDDAGAGLEIACPGCGKTVTVPTPAPLQAPPPATPPVPLAPPEKRASPGRVPKSATTDHAPRSHRPTKDTKAKAAPDRPQAGEPDAPSKEISVPDPELIRLKSHLATAERDLDAGRAEVRRSEDASPAAKEKALDAQTIALGNHETLRAKVETELGELRAESRRLSDERNTLADRLRESEAARTRVEGLLRESHSATDEARLALTQLQTTLAEERTAATDQASRIASLEKDLASARDDVATAEANNSRLTQSTAEDMRRISAQLAEEKAAQEKLHQELADARDAIASKDSRIVEITARASQEASSANERIQAISSELNETRSARDAAQADLAAARESLAAKDARITEIQSANNRRMDEDGKKISDLETRLSESLSRIAGLEKNLSDLANSRAEAERDRDRLRQGLSAAEATASGLRTELEGLQRHSANLAHDLKVSQEDATKQRQERDLMRSERETARTEANRLRRELHEAIQRAQRTTSIKERLEEDLREALAELEGFRSGELTRENKVLKGIIERRNAEAQKEKEEMVRGRRKLQSLRHWVAILIWISGFSLVAAIIEAVLLWAKFSPLR